MISTINATDSWSSAPKTVQLQCFSSTVAAISLYLHAIFCCTDTGYYIMWADKITKKEVIGDMSLRRSYIVAGANMATSKSLWRKTKRRRTKWHASSASRYSNMHLVQRTCSSIGRVTIMVSQWKYNNTLSQPEEVVIHLLVIAARSRHLGNLSNTQAPLLHTSRRWKSITDSVCYFIAENMMPYDTANAAGFRHMLHEMESHMCLKIGRALPSTTCHNCMSGRKLVSSNR